ncbi:MAG: DNA polymerase III subunit beta [Candidatus Berkelbacteria bacterium]|nr:DNA polymerase III subunit beta [Candidatus Berkelbacteria bacterium]
MKISCKRENLARGLAQISRMVKIRATLPVLSNVMIATDKGRLKLVATDLEAAVSHWIGAKCDEEGAVTVPARTLVDYVTTSADDTLTLVSAGSDLSIKGTRHHATIKGISAEEFPIIPHVKDGSPVILKAADLKAAILSVAQASALDETRPVLSGVLFRSGEKNIRLVATDSYRLAEKTITTDKTGDKLDVIIPARMAAEIARILPQDNSEVEIVAGDNQVEFRFGDIQFLSRQIEGAFPDYEQIIPKEFVLEAEIDKAEFTEAIKMANIFAREEGSNVKIDASDSEMLISAIASQVGNAENHVKVSGKGSAVSCAFNARFILDSLSVFSGETINFGFSGPMSAGLITGKDDPDFKYVVMPLRNE